MTVDRSLQEQFRAAVRERHSEDVAPGGGGPHDPGMEQRVTTLEADMKDVKGSLNRIETTLGRMDEALKHLATKAELNTVAGSVNTLTVKVDSLGSRLDGVEKTVGSALTTAVGKAIGPAQFLTMIGTSIAIFVAGVAAYGWVTAQPWFHH